MCNRSHAASRAPAHFKYWGTLNLNEFVYTWFGKDPVPLTLASLWRPPIRQSPWAHSLRMLTAMKLGSPIFSPDRMQLSKLIMFAECQRGSPLTNSWRPQSLGRAIIAGWHLRDDLYSPMGLGAGISGLLNPYDSRTPGRPIARLRSLA